MIGSSLRCPFRSFSELNQSSVITLAELRFRSSGNPRRCCWHSCGWILFRFLLKYSIFLFNYGCFFFFWDLDPVVVILKSVCWLLIVCQFSYIVSSLSWLFWLILSQKLSQHTTLACFFPCVHAQEFAVKAPQKSNLFFGFPQSVCKSPTCLARHPLALLPNLLFILSYDYSDFASRTCRFQVEATST